jgi:hypothetical protein
MKYRAKYIRDNIDDLDHVSAKEMLTNIIKFLPKDFMKFILTIISKKRPGIMTSMFKGGGYRPIREREHDLIREAVEFNHEDHPDETARYRVRPNNRYDTIRFIHRRTGWGRTKSERFYLNHVEGVHLDEDD